jgi:DUF1680 family protein
MNMKKILVPFCWLFLIGALQAQPATGDYPYKPVKFSDVKVEDDFWSPRIETNRTVTIPFAFNKCKETGRLKNFEVAGLVNSGKLTNAEFCSRFGYDDSDVYKIIEGAAYSLTTHYDAALDKALDTLIADIASAQEPDGYLYTMRTINPARSWAPERWVNARKKGSHELYNVGHMYEAAVAHFYATGKKSLLDVAIKNADLLCSTFGPGERPIASGHQEIEIGLAKLYRVTGNSKYLELARFLLDQRGKGPARGGEYTQDHLPVIEQQEAVGHAVRATYMYSAMADVAALLNDPQYVRAIDVIWENVVGKKYYITGGIGADPNWEAFGGNYELPNLTAYNETCAAIANVFWNHRMFLLHGDSKYVDVLERTLYNGLISGVSLDGNTFFYPNPLEAEGDYERSEWFDCSCCPSNVTRFISSISGYIYATRNDSLFVNLFIGSKGVVELKGDTIGVQQATAYPWQGEVSITLDPHQEGTFALCVRIPGWAKNEPVPGDLYGYADDDYSRFSILVNGISVSPPLAKGYAVLRQTWKKGDVVELQLPMPVRKILANEKVTEDRDKLCLTRGPVVFCAEGIDNDGEVSNIIIPPGATFTAEFDEHLLKGVEVLKGKALRLTGDGYPNPITRREINFKAIPYYAWCHRAAGKMNVWFFSGEKVFTPDPKPASSLFLDQVGVSLKLYDGQENRYTLDGASPTKSSSLYSTPISITSTTVLKAVAFNREGNPSEEVTATYTKTGLQTAVSVEKPEPGLRYLYARGRFDKLPSESTLMNTKTGTVNDLDVLSPRDTADYYYVSFKGYIRAPADGIYTFYVNSDDGSQLLIGDRVIVANDGIHGEVEKSGQAALQAGLHSLEVRFFEYNYAEVLEVSWEGPGLPRQKIPGEAFFYSR